MGFRGPSHFGLSILKVEPILTFGSLSLIRNRYPFIAVLTESVDRWALAKSGGCVAQLVARLTQGQKGQGSILGPATFVYLSTDSRAAVVKLWRKYVHLRLYSGTPLKLFLHSTH